MDHSAGQLSSLSRNLTRLVAIVSALLGLVMFVAPAWSAANFAWKVSPFVLMTLGGWFLGNAFIAWEAARVWEWGRIYASLIYLWMFGVFELLVLVLFRERVTLSGALGIPYLLALGLYMLLAVLGIFDWIHRRPSLVLAGSPVGPLGRTSTVLFVLFVAALAIGGAQAGQGGRSTEGAIFPEKLTLFTVRAFAAYFASLSVGAAALLWARASGAMEFFGRTGIALIIPILVAAFVNLDKFDFGAKPGGIVYIGAYVAVFIGTVAMLVRSRRR